MLFRNTMAQSTSFALGYLFSFLLAPLMIARLGLDAFGVWAVTGALATYAGLLDLGVGRSLSRFIAVYDTTGEDHRIRECVGLGLLIVTFVGVLAAIVAAAVAPLLSDELGVLNSGEMRLVLLASVAIWTFNGYDGVCSSIGIGRQRMVPPCRDCSWIDPELCLQRCGSGSQQRSDRLRRRKRRGSDPGHRAERFRHALRVAVRHTWRCRRLRS